MRDFKKISNKFKLVKSGTILSAFLWLISFGVLFNSIPSIAPNLITGLADFDETNQEISVPEENLEDYNWNTIITSFISTIIIGILFFILLSYQNRLKSLLVIGSQKHYLKTTPNQALSDFFDILLRMSTKNSNINYVRLMFETIRKENKSKNPLLDDIKMSFNKNNISVIIKKKVEWSDLHNIFELYLTKLNIDRNTFISIANYEQKKDLVRVLNKLSEITRFKEG